MMQLIMPQEEQKEKVAIHPVAIFKEGWGIYHNNAGRFSAAYLSIYLPVAVLSVVQVLFMQSTKPTRIGVAIGIIAALVSSWGYLVLMRIAHRALEGESSNLGESIKGAGRYFLYYAGATLITLALMALLWIIGGILMALGVGLLWQTNKAAAAIIFAILFIACVAVSVYFSLRWSLFGVLCVTEEAHPITALRRSYSLVKDYVNPVVGEYSLVMAITIFLILPFVIALNATVKSQLAAGVIYVIYNSIINILLLPLWNTVLVVLYRKLKGAAG